MLPLKTATDWFSFQQNPFAWAKRHPCFEEAWTFKDHSTFFNPAKNLIQQPWGTERQSGLNIHAFLSTLLEHPMDWTFKGYKGIHAGHFVLSYGTHWTQHIRLLEALVEKGVDFHTPDNRGIQPWMLLFTEARQILKRADAHPYILSNRLTFEALEQWISEFEIIVRFLPQGSLNYSVEERGKSLMLQWIEEIAPLQKSLSETASLMPRLIQSIDFIGPLEKIMLQNTMTTPENQKLQRRRL